MAKISFYDDANVPKNIIKDYSKRLKVFTNQVKEEIKKGYENEYGFINLVRDKVMINKIKALADYYKNSNIEYVVVIGIGGSIVGTRAILESLKGINYNEYINPKILFLDNLDNSGLDYVIKKLDETLSRGKKVIVNLVSKSGSTMESIANFEVILSILKNYGSDYSKNIVITTETNSVLFNIASQNNFNILDMPEKVSGRYSVLSAVGLFPLAVVGIDIDKIINGAYKSAYDNLHESESISIINSIIMYQSYHAKKPIYEIMLYGNSLEYFGKWYKQLIAESIGKEFNKYGNKVNIGITPIVSIGTSDLHSTFQLDVGGPRDKLIGSISIGNTGNKKIPSYKNFMGLATNIQGKSINKIISSVVKAVNESYKLSNIPHTWIELDELNEFNIGYLIMTKEIEVICLAYLFNVNAFDQPNVELYKNIAKNKLKK